jgi:FkbM family methyltransferase
MKPFNVILNKSDYVIYINYLNNAPIKANVVISDIKTNITYYKFYWDFGDAPSMWSTALSGALIDIIKFNPKFQGFIVKIYIDEKLVQVEYLKTTSDLITYENFINDENDCIGNSYVDFFYGTLCNNINFSNIVVDAGANYGFFTMLAKENKASRIYAIEPDMRAFFYLDRNFNNDSSIIMINKALSKDCNGIEFYYCKETTVANTQYPLNDDYIKSYVETVDIKSILSIEKEINLVKLDVEGSEYEILDNLSSNEFDSINQFFIEFHNGVKSIPKILLENKFNIEYRNCTEADLVGFIFAYK